MPEMKLKPCPHCGEEAHCEKTDGGLFVVSCWTMNCLGDNLPEYPSEEEAITAWNEYAAKTEKLLPCPFCGSRAEVVETVMETFVVCKYCGATGGHYYNAKTAIVNWNERWQLGDTPLEVTMLTEKLEAADDI